jgi:anti-sigma regulatory factor (Ser/Thr protein kinase)
MEIVSSVTHVSLPVTDVSQVGEVRRAANSIAEELGLAEEQSGRLSVIVTEAATNLAIHAKNGEVLLCPSVEDGIARVDVLAIDRGPGILDVERSISDGFSTAGTPGNGLGAISRMSDHFDIYSDRTTGTVLLSRIYAVKRGHHGHRCDRGFLHAGFVSIPKRGERLCGDTVAARIVDGGGVFMVADGLGHGIAANEASGDAAKIFYDETSTDPASLLDSVHHALRGSRGAAVAIAEIDCNSRILKYSGVGNIAAAILQDATSRSLISHNGIVGHQMHKIQEFVYPWPDSGMLVMNSDGLQTNWRLTSYAGLSKKDPAIIAAILYRDFSRGTDDVAVLVIKRGEDA